MFLRRELLIVNLKHSLQFLVRNIYTTAYDAPDIILANFGIIIRYNQYLNDMISQGKGQKIKIQSEIPCAIYQTI